MNLTIVKDCNAGNSCNTYWKAFSDREFCITDGSNYLRDSKGRVRRFASRRAAQATIDKIIKQAAREPTP